MVKQKKVAKALRARFGVEDGVQPARFDHTEFAWPSCEVVVDAEAESLADQLCPTDAHVIEGGKGLCEEHMKQAHKRRRR